MKSQKIKWFFIAYFVLLILVLTLIGIFGQLGYLPIDMGMVCLIFGILVCSALIGGTVFLVKRMNTKPGQILVGCIGAIITFFIATILVVVSTVLLNFGISSHYVTLTSPAGEDVVVVRTISDDAALQDMRRTGQTDEAINMDRLGYSYSAHPRFLHFFYNSKVRGEGELEIGVASQAVLMQQWPDDNTLCLFIQDPEPGDAGEILFYIK